MQVRTHKYAEAAFPKVKNMIGKNSNGSNLEVKYRTLALNFPTMIMQSGLAQAMGFLMAKGKEEHVQLLEHIQQILEKPKLYEDILKSDVTEYQLLTRKTLDATAWIKRYAQALLKKEASE